MFEEGSDIKMAKEEGNRESGMIFTEEELQEMSGVRKGGDFVEVTCGCTSHTYGDAVGLLRVFVNGDLEIICKCTPGCDEGPSLISFLLSSKYDHPCY